MRIRSRLLTRIGLRLILWTLRLLYATCRKQVVTWQAGDEINPYTPAGEQRFLYSIWHDDILMTVFTGRPQQTAALVSRHQDGGYLSDVLRAVGIEPVRGSTSRGGAQALRQLLDLTRDRHISITPDGPRGPRHRLKPGIVFLASQSGRSIVPVAFACKRSWRIRGSWTDMLLPQPFTKVICVGGPPLSIPAELSREHLAEEIRRVEQQMAVTQQIADAFLAGRTPAEITAAVNSGHEVEPSANTSEHSQAA